VFAFSRKFHHLLALLGIRNCDAVLPQLKMEKSVLPLI
jgi:hypothetical protein